MDQVTMITKVLDETNRVVNGIEPSQLDNPSPCDEWTVRDVLNHITAGATMFAVCVRDGSMSDEQLGAVMAGDNLGSDYKAAFRAASVAALDAFDEPGAAEKMVKLPFGEMPAGVALSIAIFDVATHACDLATATGQKVDDEELLGAALEMGKQMIGPDLRVPGVFGPEQACSDDASTTQKLLAFAGRTV